MSWRETCELFVEKLCAECQDNIGRDDKFHEIKLCNDCRMSDKYVLICKTNAKKEYYLKDEDIEELKHISVKNPTYRNSSDMKLYKKEDIITIFREKYGVDEDQDFKEVLDSLEEEKSSRSAKICATR